MSWEGGLVGIIKNYVKFQFYTSSPAALAFGRKSSWHGNFAFTQLCPAQSACVLYAAQTHANTRTHIQYDCEDAFELPSAFYPINCIKEKGLSLKTVIPVYRDSTHTALPFSTKLIPYRTESTLYLYAHSFLFVPVFTFLRFVMTVFEPINSTVQFLNQF